ncbi:hypothetical protein QMO14_17140 [Variovorax sp. CAN2819]|uniref:hypothetical protein n=1 Tax=Variovorax sp. CAN15 TaxID=3046727 RepID=UPI002648DBB6|nr:hypothetical protein [Variovorax sp. CAN15]MDN6885334.1 hypothetical protein [Variovorax sp. CAN15]
MSISAVAISARFEASLRVAGRLARMYRNSRDVDVRIHSMSAAAQAEDMLEGAHETLAKNFEATALHLGSRSRINSGPLAA